MKILRPFLIILAALSASASGATMVITEFMYNGSGGAVGGTNTEFVEFTNVSSAPIDMAGWSFDDISGVSGSFDLSAFGVVAPGQSVILCEQTASAFIASWGLTGVTVVGGLANPNNLGRADAINLYNGTTLIDSLAYDDQTLGGPRTAGISATTAPANYGANTITTWVLSTNGVNYAHTSANGDIGSPGIVPEPSSLLLFGAAGMAAALRRRRA